MNARDQYRVLKRIEEELQHATVLAGQLPGGQPLIKKILDAERLVSAWRCDQEAELPDG